MEQIKFNNLDAVWRRRAYAKSFAPRKRKRKKMFVQPPLNDPITQKMQQQKLDAIIVFNCPYEDCSKV